jgi:putative heme-binding domain-containing protein
LLGLQGYADESISQYVLARFPGWDEQVRETALWLLASRPAWSIALLEAVTEQRLPPLALSGELRQVIQLHDDPRLDQLRTELGWAAESAAGPRQLQLRALSALESGSADPYAGRALFAESCQKCHRLFRQGALVGPDLTPYPRGDAATLLNHIVNPSLEIREGYETWILETEDGRLLTGFLADEDNRSITLRMGDMQQLTLAKDQVLDRRRSGRSLMPEGLLEPLSDQQIRDLLAFLRLSQPLNEPN